MRIGRSRKLTINMGDYESYTPGAWIEVSHADLGFTDEEWAALSTEERTEKTRVLEAAALKLVNRQLEEEVKEAGRLSIDRKSFIFRAISRGASADADAKPRSRKRKAS